MPTLSQSFARLARAAARTAFALACFALAWLAGVALADYGVQALAVIVAVILVGGTVLGVMLDDDPNYFEDAE